MTINEACIKVLTELGGRAPLKLLCMKVQEIVVFKGATPYNSICTELINHPKNFRRTEGKKGWWELVSFQEEIASRDKRIKELEEVNARLKSVKTEDDFVRRMVAEAKILYKHDKDSMDVIRQILHNLGRSDAEEELDAWIEGRVYKPSDTVTGAIADLNKTLKNGVEEGVTIINAGNYKPQIQTQNVGMPTIGQQTTKRIEK
jgi:hypothetical protein